MTREAFLAVAIDDACGQIHAAWRLGERPRRLALSPALYRDVVRARGREQAAGGPLLLLDLEVEEDARLSGAEVRVC